MLLFHWDSCSLVPKTGYLQIHLVKWLLCLAVVICSAERYIYIYILSCTIQMNVVGESYFRKCGKDQNYTSEIKLSSRILHNKDLNAIPFLNNEIPVIKTEFQFFQISTDGNNWQCLCFLFKYCFKHKSFPCELMLFDYV